MKHLVLVPVVIFIAFVLSFAQVLAKSTYIQQNIRSTGSESVKVELRQEVNSGGQTQTNFRSIQTIDGSPRPFPARCASFIARINARVGFYNERRDNHLQHYENLKTRLQTLMMHLDNRGFDTSGVEAEIQELDRLVTAASSSYSDFITKLEAMKSIDCNEESEAFRTALQDSKTALETFQNNLKAIREHVQGDLKNSLQALKNQEPTQE